MVPDIWKKYFNEEWLNRDKQKLTRKLRSLRHLGSTKVQIGSHEFLNFSSNDYLGLTGDLRIAEAAASAAGRFGWGTAASRLVTGSSTLHTKLEGEIAAFRGTEAALLFGSGYQANLGVISALVGTGDTVLSDAMNHASIVAGCKLSGATVRVFKHRDCDDLERNLNGVKKGRILVVTDTLFSIEGDTADLPRIVKLCERFNALLMADDAHANGCLGKRGRGMPEIQGVNGQIPIVVATFSKGLGSYGGFVACSEQIRDFLVNNSRPFIYTTSIPIALAAANLEALKIVRREGDGLRQKLATNTAFARTKLESAGFELTGNYQIIGVNVESPEEAMFISGEVEFHGVLIHPMRWPTVPRDKSCLRVSITAAHTEEDISRMVDALKKARNSMAKKKTDGLTRRVSRRPTEQQLETMHAASDDDFGDFDQHPGDGMMSAADSSKLPPPDQVSDFSSDNLMTTAGDTMIAEEGFAGNDRPTAPLEKKSDETPTEPVASRPEEDPQEPDPARISEPEEIQEELPVDDEPAPSGATLAPEAMELEDPVIAEIEGGTKKRQRKTARQKKPGS
ncbi:MAG: 8-amino-7-oxononanoate synthase [Planctomycetes bacterium]|nr:8-amino-7-oxononanoate synthase [Planctomycetota bacterium]